jgi:hypothetical protein
MTQTYGAIKKSKRKVGGHLKRTMIIHTRMSPKLKFIADLIARHQNRTLSSLIESLLVEVAERHHLPAVVTEKAQTDHYLFGERQTKKVTAQEIGERLWSAEEADRFAAMALFVPTLLTVEEDALWQAIMETPYFWNHFEIHIENPAGQVVETEWWPLIDYRGFNCERLREHWPLCQAILDGAEPIEKFKALDLPSGKRVEKPDYYPYPIKKVRTDQ